MTEKWKIFYSTDTAWEAMLMDISRAQTSIHLEQFLFNDFDEGQIGGVFLDALIKKAKEGVKIKILVDSFGSSDFFVSNETDNLDEYGIDLRYHALSKKNIIANLFPNLYRDHRKVLIVDEKVGYMGGVVIGEEVRGWRDTQVRMENNLVPLLKNAYDAIWNSLEKTSSGPYQYKNRHLNENSEGFLGNCPREKDKALRKEILSKISQSKNRVWITTPYFTPSKKMTHALMKASGRGVDVRIILPENTDNIFGDFVAKSFFQTLIKRGVQIYRYREMIHAKTIVVDDWVSVGSFNLDFLSEYFNHELNLVTHNKRVLEDIVAQFYVDFKKASLYTYNDYKREPFYKKLAWRFLNLLKVFT